MNTPVAFQAHCIWCGRDADSAARKTGRCARCGATLLLELDLEPRRIRTARRPGETVTRERRPRRRPVAEALTIT